jgi:hypothetical protein
MPVYRGVDSADIRDSLKQAVARLRELALGDSVGALLDQWESQSPDPCTLLDSNVVLLGAPSDSKRELAMMMEQSGTKKLFSRFGGVFEYLGLAALDEGGNEQDIALLQSLARWGAFLPREQKDDDALDRAAAEEIKRFLRGGYMDHLSPEDCEPGGACSGILEEKAGQLKTAARERDQDGGLAEWLAFSIPLYAALHENGQDEMIDNLIAAREEADRARVQERILMEEEPDNGFRRSLGDEASLATLVTNTLHSMTGLAARVPELELDHPLHYYRAVISRNATPPPANDVTDAFNSARDTPTEDEALIDEASDLILEALKPFLPSDEASPKFTVSRADGGATLRLILLATPEAAQAAADALPQFEFRGRGDTLIAPRRADAPSPLTPS